MPKIGGKNRFCDADRQKTILYSYSTLYSLYTSKKHIIIKKHPFLCTFTGPLP